MIHDLTLNQFLAEAKKYGILSSCLICLPNCDGGRPLNSFAHNPTKKKYALLKYYGSCDNYSLLLSIDKIPIFTSLSCDKSFVLIQRLLAQLETLSSPFDPFVGLCGRK